MEWKTITKGELKTLIDTHTYVALGKMFGISDTAVKKKAKRFGVWKRKKKYNGHNDHLRIDRWCDWCGKKISGYAKKYCVGKGCQAEYQYHEIINKWLLGVIDSIDHRRYKRWLIETTGNKCSECGIENWNGKPIVMDIEHKDGDSNNDDRNNVCLLCPNCHSQTDTFKGKNRGNGRHIRRQRYNDGKSY